MSSWISNSPSFTQDLPKLAFPIETLPDLYAPERTMLVLADGSRLFPYMWCYLQRKTTVARKTEFKSTSLSASRVAAMPAVMRRLSQWARSERWRPRTIHSLFEAFSAFLLWADSSKHKGKYEKLLDDKDVALDALKNHHRFIRHRAQSNQITLASAAKLDRTAIYVLSELHDFAYVDKIEPIQSPAHGGTDAPTDEHVAAFMSTLQAIFDSAAALILEERTGTGAKFSEIRKLRLSASDDSKTTTLPATFPEGRLIDLACTAFAGLVLGDSGANLSVLQEFEEPDDLFEQLDNPERMTLTQKVVKFRAGGKPVPVHLTATTFTRLRSFLAIRERFIKALDCDDVQSLFVQGKWDTARNHWQDPISVQTLRRGFLDKLRSKVNSVGGTLPSVTLRQLRLHKQQHLVRKSGPSVAANVMGTTVITAIRSYSKAHESVQHDEIGSFLDQLSATVLDASNKVPTTATPAGSCLAHGDPQAYEGVPPVSPDCKKTEGCFFCQHFCVHADEVDLKKLFSCRHVLLKLAPLQGDSMTADRVYQEVLNRIESLLDEIKKRIPGIYSSVDMDVRISGNLTTYWATKLQQLYLLGLLTDESHDQSKG